MGSISNVFKKVTAGLGVSKVLDMLGGGNDAADAARRAAEQQQRQFDLQLQQQNEAAKLSGSNMIDNLTNVQTGDALAAIDGLTSSKKKRLEGTGISSALGVG